MSSSHLRSHLFWFIVFLLALLAGCGGGGGDDGGGTTSYQLSVSASPVAGGTATGSNTYTSGSSATVTALANAGYTFGNWTESGTPVSSNASYTFSMTADRVLVAQFALADYAIGGSVSGLVGTVVLQNNGGDDVWISGDGSFTFATPVTHGSEYAVTILSQPEGQVCSVNQGSGTVNAAPVTDVNVVCSFDAYTIGGTVTGLSGTVVLQNNGGDDLTITANGSFEFATALADGAAYEITVLEQPADQSCSVSDGGGLVASGHVSDAVVNCENVIPTYTISTIVGAGLTIEPVITEVDSGSAASFTITRDAGYAVDSATGCGGSYDVATGTYITGAVTADCTILVEPRIAMTLTPYTISSALPSVITLVQRVSDRITGEPITGLTKENFQILEDGEPIAEREAFLDLEPFDDIQYKLKTVLMIDVSSSLTTDDLSKVKEAAIRIVNNRTEYQKIAVYVFDDSIRRVIDFSDSTEALTDAINGITRGGPSTNLYGAVVHGFSLWSNAWSLEQVTHGTLILITDGNDTASLSTLEAAIAAKGERDFFALTVGGTINTDPLVQIALGRQIDPITDSERMLAERYLFSVEDYSQVDAALQQIAVEVERLTQGLYFLYYATPKRSGEHTVSVSVVDNSFCRAWETQCVRTLNGKFVADGFYNVSPELLLNHPGQTLLADQSYQLSARVRWENPPFTFLWELDNADGQMTLVVDPLDSSQAMLTVASDVALSRSTVRVGVLEVPGLIQELEFVAGIPLTDVNGSVDMERGIQLSATDPVMELASGIPCAECAWSVADSSVVTLSDTTGDSVVVSRGTNAGATTLTVYDPATGQTTSYPIAWSYLVSTSVGTGGTVSPTSENVSYGSTASFTVTANAGYAVSGVSGCEGSLSGDTYITEAIAAECTVTATFLPTFIVATAATENGTLSPSDQTVMYGEKATFVALPDAGYGVSSVTGCGGVLEDDTYTTGAITTNCTVNATFLPAYTVSTSTDTGGTLSPDTRTVVGGNTTSFTVMPDSGYALVSLNGCGGTLSGSTYTTGAINEDCTVGASFAPTYVVGGTITGLPEGETLHLRLNDSDTRTLDYTANGHPYFFDLELLAGADYRVSLLAPSGRLHCTVANASGVMEGSAAMDVNVNCEVVPLFAGGASHSVLLQTDGSLWSWGGNGSGQLGLGDTTNHTGPVQLGTEHDWISVTAGSSHTLGIKSDGSLWAWGLNSSGQLGLGDSTNRTSPVQVGTATDWVSVKAGTSHTLALKSDGSLWAWGYNAYSQLGLGDYTNRSIPVQVGTATDWVGIAAGGSHTLALKFDGSLWAWGSNGTGQLGLGDITTRMIPVQVGTATDWVSITAGHAHTLALKSDGSLWAWGYNNTSQLGLGDTINRTSPVQVGTDTDWVSVAAAMYHTLAIKSEGSLWAWGYNNTSQLGLGDTTTRTSPVQVGTDADWVSVTAGTSHTLGVKSDGSPWGWGFNSSGQLGVGDVSNRTSPVRVGTLSEASDWQSVTAGDFHGAGVNADGSLWAWGYNSYGQLGLGDTSSRTSPVQVGPDTDWLTVTAGASHTLALKSDGSLWAWGANSSGQLGLGDTTLRTSPVQVGTATDWVSIAAGTSHTLGVKSDGSLWAWGLNSSGQLGLGDAINRTSPVQVGTAADWVTVTAGASHTLALKSDGSLWAWGFNSTSQLGLGDTTTRISPVQVGTETDWVSVTAGAYHTLALKSDGSLWAWGYNNASQLGLGDTTTRTSPVQVGTATDWVSLTAAMYHTLALKSDGSLWAWGLNSSGQLGLGDATTRTSPVQVGTDADWVTVTAGNNHSLAIRSDGNLWSWGGNSVGQLGIVDTTNRSSPVRVGTIDNW